MRRSLTALNKYIWYLKLATYLLKSAGCYDQPNLSKDSTINQVKKLIKIN